MSVQDLMHYFGTDNLSKLARLLGVTRATVFNWRKANQIPYLQQLHVQKVTNGALLAEDSK